MTRRTCGTRYTLLLKLSIVLTPLTLPRYVIYNVRASADKGQQIIAHDNSEAPSQMWSFNDYKFEKPQYTQIFDAKEAAAMIKQLEGENERLEGEVDLLQKKLEAVRLALDIDGTEVRYILFPCRLCYEESS